MEVSGETEGLQGSQGRPQMGPDFLNMALQNKNTDLRNNNNGNLKPFVQRHQMAFGYLAYFFVTL